MNSDVNAIYEGGAFWPLKDQDVAVPEGKLVRLTVQSASPAAPLDVLSLAGRVYEGLSPEEIGEVERIALDRSNFFLPTTA